MRRGIIQISGAILPECTRALIDDGWKFVGSVGVPATISAFTDGVRLVVEGPDLPEACEEGPCLLCVTFTQENYGEQKIVRVSAVEVAERLSAREVWAA